MALDYGKARPCLASSRPVQRPSIETVFERASQFRVCCVRRQFDDWGKLIGDVPSATAILDRFLHRADIVQITGKSYRLENSGNGPKSTKAPTGSKAEEE